MKCAIVHSGQFFHETLSLAKWGLPFAKDVLRNTTCAHFLTILTRWNNEPHVQGERDWFNVVINMPPPNLCGKEDLVHCHIKSAFSMISMGIAAAKHWRADYILRVRTDMLVEKFALPQVFDDRCIYSYNNPFAPGTTVSDNIMFGPTQTIEHAFRPVGARIKGSPENLVQKRVHESHVTVCPLSELSVWLVKPYVRTTEQRSLGTRHWYTKRKGVQHESCKHLRVYANKSIVCSK